MFIIMIIIILTQNRLAYYYYLILYIDKPYLNPTPGWVKMGWVGLGPRNFNPPKSGFRPIFDNPTNPITRWVRVTRRVNPVGRELYVINRPIIPLLIQTR